MNTFAPPPIPAFAPSTKSFAHQAAKVSWASVVVTIVPGIFANTDYAGSKFLLESLAFVVMCFGFALAVTSLAGIRKHGVKGILVPAIVGFILNGLLRYIFVTNFLAARAKAQENIVQCGSAEERPRRWVSTVESQRFQS